MTLMFPESIDLGIDNVSFNEEYWWSIATVSFLLITIFFIIHSRHNQNIPTRKRNLWTALIIFCNIFVLPTYWWYCIRNNTKVTSSGIIITNIILFPFLIMAISGWLNILFALFHFFKLIFLAEFVQSLKLIVIVFSQIIMFSVLLLPISICFVFITELLNELLKLQNLSNPFQIIIYGLIGSILFYIPIIPLIDDLFQIRVFEDVLGPYIYISAYFTGAFLWIIDNLFLNRTLTVKKSVNQSNDE